MAIIATYNKTAQKIQKRFKPTFKNEIQILTIDKSQGNFPLNHFILHIFIKLGIDKELVILVCSTINDRN